MPAETHTPFRFRACRRRRLSVSIVVVRCFYRRRLLRSPASSSHLLLPQGRLRAEGRLFLPQTEKVQASVLLRLPTRPSPFPLPPVACFPLASSGVRLPQYVTLVSTQMALKRSPASSYVSPSLKVRASQTYAISLCSPPLASPLPSSLIPAQLLLRPLLLVPPIPPPP